MVSRHVTLIRPPNVVHKTTLATNSGAPPLALACLSAALKKSGWRVTVIDAFGEAMDRFTQIETFPFLANGLSTDEILSRVPEDTCLIGVSSMFSNEWLCHRRVINALTERFPGTPLIVGGEHASAAPEYVLRSCPGALACVLGEGELSLLELLDALESGRALNDVAGLCIRQADSEAFSRTTPRSRIRDLDSLPWPDWDSVPIENYLAAGVGFGVARGRNMPLLASRGCPYKCSFCSNRQMWGKLWNVRSAADVVAEMEHYIRVYGAESFSFYDLTTVIRREWILEFTNLLREKELGVPWQMPSGTRSESLDAEVVANLKKSGCVGLVYAPESGSPVTLKRVNKQLNLDRMLASMRACAQQGLQSKAHIILGFPGETRREMLRSLQFMARMAWVGITDVAVYPFVPYPGSEFHEQLRLTTGFPSEGDDYDQFLAFNCNNNYFGVRSWNDHLSDWQLRLWCIAAMLMFYVMHYTFRPWRFAGSIYRVVASRPQTLLERIFDTFIWRQRKMLAAKLRFTGVHAKERAAHSRAID